MRGIRGLLAAVILMGVLILLGTAVLVGTVVNRAIQIARSTGTPTQAALPAADLRTLMLGQPAGTRIGGVIRQSDAQMAVILTGGGAPDRVLIWEPALGRIVARLVVGP